MRRNCQSLASIEYNRTIREWVWNIILLQLICRWVIIFWLCLLLLQQLHEITEVLGPHACSLGPGIVCVASWITIICIIGLNKWMKMCLVHQGRLLGFEATIMWSRLQTRIRDFSPTRLVISRWICYTYGVDYHRMWMILKANHVHRWWQCSTPTKDEEYLKCIQESLMIFCKPILKDTCKDFDTLVSVYNRRWSV